MINNILQRQNEAYRNNFIAKGACPEGVFWNNSQTQNLRFQKLIENLQIDAQTTIHDVGCGICDFHQYLHSLQIEHKYSGTEIVQEMIDFATKKYPALTIFKRDLLNAPDNEKYDFLVLSGTLNLLANIALEDWREYVFQLILKMYAMSNKGISFNFLTTYKTFTDNSLCYFNPNEMFEFCAKNLSRFIILNHAYPLYEASITVFREEFIKSKYYGEEFEKYFN